jgi:hypothetical protein
MGLSWRSDTAELPGFSQTRPNSTRKLKELVDIELIDTALATHLKKAVSNDMDRLEDAEGSTSSCLTNQTWHQEPEWFLRIVL